MTISFEDLSDNINHKLISGKLGSNLTRLNTKSSQIQSTSQSVKPLEEHKIPLENIDE